MYGAITRRALMSSVLPEYASIARFFARRDGGSTGEVQPASLRAHAPLSSGNPVWPRRRNAASGRRVDCSTVSFFELALNVENDVLRGRRSSQPMRNRSQLLGFIPGRRPDPRSKSRRS